MAILPCWIQSLEQEECCASNAGVFWPHIFIPCAIRFSCVFAPVRRVRGRHDKVFTQNVCLCHVFGLHRMGICEGSEVL